MEKYLTLLQTFGVKNQVDELLSTSSYVTMDNIHDAIILTGVDMEAPLKHYEIKAKQQAIDEYRANVNQRRLRDAKGHLTQTSCDNWDWEQYGLTMIEIECVKEWIGGVPLNKSQFSKRIRAKHRLAITKKVLATLTD